jgi:tetratricopeptide (TPR) repeat protein
MPWVRSVLVLCLLTGVAAADDAATRRQASEHYHKGTTAYDLGHYDTAINEYETAYALYNEPTILYNLGQAHRLARHSEQALHFYKMYLVKVPGATNRAEVEAKIAALTSAIEEERKARNIPPDQTIKPPESTTPPTAATPPSTPPPSSAATTPSEPPGAAATTGEVRAPAPVDPRARTFKIAGIVVGAAGIALVAGGIVCGVLAKQNADAISSADANHQPYEPSKYSDYQNDLVASGVLIGVGAAAVVTGTVLAIVGMRRGHKAMALQIDPQLSPTRAGAAATIRF